MSSMKAKRGMLTVISYKTYVTVSDLEEAGLERPQDYYTGVLYRPVYSVGVVVAVTRDGFVREVSVPPSHVGYQWRCFKASVKERHLGHCTWLLPVGTNLQILKDLNSVEWLTLDAAREAIIPYVQVGRVFSLRDGAPSHG